MAMDHGRGFRTLLLPRPPSSAHPFLYPSSPLSSSSSVPTMIARRAALKIHSQAEKNRREKINTHLSTLRHMIPDSHKMDKASLLGRVVDQVKSLKRKAVLVMDDGLTIPTEVDEVQVMEYHDCQIKDPASSIFFKASICCDERPELFVDLARAFHELKLRAVKAEMTSLGGRVHSVFILCCKNCSIAISGGVICMSSLKESIRKALAMVACFEMGSQDAISGKRRRLMELHK